MPRFFSLTSVVRASSAVAFLSFAACGGPVEGLPLLVSESSIIDCDASPTAPACQPSCESTGTCSADGGTTQPGPTGLGGGYAGEYYFNGSFEAWSSWNNTSQSASTPPDGWIMDPVAGSTVAWNDGINANRTAYDGTFTLYSGQWSANTNGCTDPKIPCIIPNANIVMWSPTFPATAGTHSLSLWIQNLNYTSWSTPGNNVTMDVVWYASDCTTALASTTLDATAANPDTTWKKWETTGSAPIGTGCGRVRLGIKKDNRVLRVDGMQVVHL